MPPCVIFEDEHLLVVNKPSGWNTHAPSPHTGEGIYDWLRHREPRWAGLAILHRLDKDTSGVLVFGKTTLANRSLTQQFAERTVRKRYVLLTLGTPPKHEWTVRSFLSRAGERYVSSSQRGQGEEAETQFRVLLQEGGLTTVLAEPRTGRTHQIRVHAADSGVPVLGDELYGGACTPPGWGHQRPPAYASGARDPRPSTSAAAGSEATGKPAPLPQRLCLHAESVTFRHPLSGDGTTVEARSDFAADRCLGLRRAIIACDRTDVCRLVHGASDGHPGWHLDQLGPFLLSQSEAGLSPAHHAELERWLALTGATGAYHKRLSRQVRRTSPEQLSPQWVCGAQAPDRFHVVENGLHFELSFREGYSVGLFLDQRDNRRRLLTGHVAAGFDLISDGATRLPLEPSEASPLRTPHSALRMLNVFAYTCAFSVCAASAGAHVTSLDLSRKYLDWGRRNFALNGLDPNAHDFIYGDAFDWLARLGKKGRTFDVVLLDPPTFSQSKPTGVFKAEKDYQKLVRAAAALLPTGGVLFASTNAGGWASPAFLADVRAGLQAAGRRVVREFYAPQPPDFPVTRAEPAYLKTVWMRVD